MPIYEEQCQSCGWVVEYYSHAITDETQPCPVCRGRSDRVISLAAVQIFQPFKTRNLDPNGREIEVKSQRQLSRLCAENGVVHVPDMKQDAPQSKPVKLEREIPKW